MSSFGETDISDDTRIVGRIRVLDILSERALFPRLSINVGITLFESPNISSQNQPTEKKDLQIRDAIGELRFSENTDVIGNVIWSGPHRTISTSFAGNESHVKFVCDLDLWILEQIERKRGGSPPKFWLQLWPTLLSNGIPIECR